VFAFQLRNCLLGPPKYTLFDTQKDRFYTLNEGKARSKAKAGYRGIAHGLEKRWAGCAVIFFLLLAPLGT